MAGKRYHRNPKPAILFPRHHTSGALAGRFILLMTTKSFLGKEDTEWSKRLRLELPGILNWALDGLDRLTERGHFVQSASAREAVEDLMRLTSPITAFIEECCVLGPDQEICRDKLYTHYETWCDRNRHVVPSREVFGRNLKAKLPTLGRRQPRIDGKQRWFYTGIGLPVTQADTGPL